MDEEFRWGGEGLSLPEPDTLLDQSMEPRSNGTLKTHTHTHTISLSAFQSDIIPETRSELAVGQLSLESTGQGTLSNTHTNGRLTLH